MEMDITPEILKEKCKLIMVCAETGVKRQNKNQKTPVYLRIEDFRFKENLDMWEKANRAFARRRPYPIFAYKMQRVDIVNFLLKFLEESSYTCVQDVIEERLLNDIIHNNLKAFQIFEWKSNILVYSLTTLNDWICRLDIHDINVFLENIVLVQTTLKLENMNIIHWLLYYALTELGAKVFKLLWFTLPHSLISVSCFKNGIQEPLRNSKLSDTEYAECLRLILTFPNAQSFFKHPNVWDNQPTVLSFILNICHRRNINKHDRISIITLTLKLDAATLDDIFYGYRLHGFNEEVVIMIESVKLYPNLFITSRSTRVLLRLLKDVDRNLVIKELGVIQKSAYLKLLNTTLSFNNHENEIFKSIYRIKERLNQPSSLYEITKFYSQKTIQKFNKIKKPDEFTKIVKNMTLPVILKESLLKDPPIYYEL